MEHANADARTVEYARSVIQQQLGELEKLSRRLTGDAPQAPVEAQARRAAGS